VATRITINDVARIAGVGVGTVSRVLNEGDNVADETRQRVLAVIASTGYQPSFAARSLRTDRVDTIGFIADAVATSPFAVDLIKGAQAAAWKHGRLLVIVDADGDERIRDKALHVMLERRVEGIVYAAMFHHAVRLPEAFQQVPTVLVDCFDDGRSFPSVVPDEVMGGLDATRRLIDKGHRRIAMISHDRMQTGYPAVVGRVEGYRQALRDGGIPFDRELLREGGGAREAGAAYREMRELLALSEPPTAIFCGNDRTAMGVYDAVRDAGLRIPSDVAVIGFDNQRVVAEQLHPPLSTMQLPHEDMGRWAVERLLMGGDAAEPMQHKLPCPFVERDSL
jgi:LacI family transcriptional regulator